MRAQVGPLIAYCMHHLQMHPEQNIEKATVYEVLYPGQIFVDGKIEKVMVEAQKLIRSVLLIQHYFQKENEFYQVFDFAEILRRRGLASRNRLSVLNLQKMQERDRQKNAHYFHRQFQLETAIHYQDSLDNQRKGDLNIPNVLYATEFYYYIRRVALLTRYLLQLRLTRLDVPLFIQTQLEDTDVPQNYLEGSPTLKINFEIFLILKKSHLEVSNVLFLFDLLRRHEKNLDAETLRILCLS